MIKFKPIEISDKPQVDKLLKTNNFNSADYSFATMYMWQNSFYPRIAIQGDRLLTLVGSDDDLLYNFPAGSGDLKDAISALQADAEERGIKFRLRGIPKNMLPVLNALFHGEYTISSDDRYHDYVYSVDKLMNLAGKKLHGKRNHINRFLEENNWAIEKITPSNLSICHDVSLKWFLQNEEEKPMDYTGEEAALHLMFKNFWELGLEGIILFSGGIPIGFTVGEVLSQDTYLTHYEKADAGINGAYPFLNREFARYIHENHPDMIYINREEDMGLENLRKAKQSYRPDLMVEKYTAVWS